MLENKEVLKDSLNQFNKEYRTTFSYEDFETKAAQLEQEKPGHGFRLAYRDALSKVYAQVIENHVSKDAKLPKINILVDAFNSMVIHPYVNECREQKQPTDLKIDYNPLSNLDNLNTLNNTLENTPTNKAAFAARQIERGELSMEGALAFSQEKSADTPSRKDALIIASYAKAFEMRNKNRSWGQVLRHPFDHIKEKFQIRSMRKAAEKCGESIKTLTDEVATDSEQIDNDYSILKKYQTIAEKFDQSRKEKEQLVVDPESTNVFSSDKSSERSYEKSNEKTTNYSL